MSELEEWVRSTPDIGEAHWTKCKADLSRLCAGWILTKLNGVMAERKIDIRTLKTTPEDFAELLSLLHERKVTGANALIILEEMVEGGADPSIIMKEKGLEASDDTEELKMIAANVVAANPKAVEDWKSGKTNAAQFLVGQMMKASRGKARPDAALQMIQAELETLAK
jgi:aspartyl-tRNA(Asn)/glutamyl-tRNA(Gln) amidotransferase subunit B